jgi:hypothetical protein
VIRPNAFDLRNLYSHLGPLLRDSRKAATGRTFAARRARREKRWG